MCVVDKAQSCVPSYLQLRKHGLQLEWNLSQEQVGDVETLRLECAAALARNTDDGPCDLERGALQSLFIASPHNEPTDQAKVLMY